MRNTFGVMGGGWAALLVLSLAWTAASAAPPAQFTAWGSAGPDLPPMPAGWTQVPAAAAPPPTWTPSEDDRRRGCVLVARETLSDEPAESMGISSGPTTELRILAARGQYESTSFVVHALADLSEVRVEVGELRPVAAGAGQAIPADQVDVRVVRDVRTQVPGRAKVFRLEPFLIERRSSFDVPAGRAKQVWITVHAPDLTPDHGAASPAISPPVSLGGPNAITRYSADLRVTPRGRATTSLKLTLEVLPFALPAVGVEMGAFYANPPADDALLRKQFIDMREHGCNTVEPGLETRIVTRDRVFGPDDVEATLTACRRMLRLQRDVFGPWRHPITFDVGNQIICYWDTKANWFVYWPHEQKMEDDLLKAVDTVAQAAKAEGVPALRAYALDEAGAHNLLDEAAYYYGLLKKRRPDIAGWTSIGGGMAMGHDEITKLAPCVEFLSTNRFPESVARQLVGLHRTYGVYNGAGHTVAGVRFFYGLWGWKTAAQEIAQWCYCFGDNLFKGAGIRDEEEGYVYLTADGPLPSLRWEAVRAGIDDYRYAQLLWSAIGAAHAAPDAAKKKAGADALRVMNDVLGRIGWGFQAMDSAEKSPPPHPGTMRKWRRAMATEIARLQEAGVDLNAAGAASAAGAAGAGTQPGAGSASAPAGAAAGLLKSGVRPTPLELPWAASAAPAVQYGPELIPADSAHPGKAPWRVESWKGKGTGALDPAAARGDTPTMRITDPAGAAENVTILVWPNWGGQKLEIPLTGGRTYEFAAWCKWQGRTTPPSMRLSLPQGIEKNTRTGVEDADAAGWQRVWTRTELAAPSKPGYMGVWVQGPGTVWVSGLSLREIIHPAVTVTLDQDSYDALDGGAVADVAVDQRMDPASVRFTLLARGGAAVVTRTAPFQAHAAIAAAGATTSPATAAPQGAPAVRFLAPTELRRCQIVFDPTSLAPGTYEAKVDLLDASGAVLASGARTFQRLADEK